MSYTKNACEDCNHRLENEETGKYYCELHPNEPIEGEDAPKYTFSSHRGTGYPDYFCCDCEDFDGIEEE